MIYKTIINLIDPGGGVRRFFFGLFFILLNAMYSAEWSYEYSPMGNYMLIGKNSIHRYTHRIGDNEKKWPEMNALQIIH